MYRRHFGLKEKPFSLTPDTQFFFESKNHREALNTMLLALRHSEGFIKIVGEVGTGKTLLCRKLLRALGDNVITAYIPNPFLTPDELKWFVAEEIGVEHDHNTPSYKLLRDIYTRLIELARDKRQVVLVVDEAQAMPRETIEALRLLTNLETEKRKLLQVVLIGQPELDVLLNREDLRQLKQRIVFSENLSSFYYASTEAYLRHRLLSAGHSGGQVFDRAAVSLLYSGSGGIPRLINIMAHKAMLSAFGKGNVNVARRDMVKAVLDTDESRIWGKILARREVWLWPILASLTAVIVVSVPHWLGVW